MPLVRPLTGPTTICRRRRGAVRAARTAKRGGVVVKRPLAALAALVALAFAAALVLLLTPGPAQAQSSVKLVGNTPSTGLINVIGTYDYGQAFTTGSHSRGYVLTSVRIRLRGGSGTGPSHRVSIHSDSSGTLGGSLGTLTNPASWPDPAALTQFNAPGGGIELAASTTYWLQFDITGNPVNDDGPWSRYETQANGEDPGAAAGWSIADDSLFKVWNTSTWQTDDRSLIFAIHGYEGSLGRQSVEPPDPPNLARNPVAWSPVGGMQALPTAMSEVSANKPRGATGSLDLSAIAASVREELRDRSRGFYLTTMVDSTSQRQHILSNLDHELAPGSPLLKVSIWHVYRRASTGINTVERLGEVFLPRKVNLLAESVKICLPAPPADADRARIAVRGSTDQEWTILETTLEDGQLCAETVRVSWFVIVLKPEPEDA